ncbi:glycosyltransferase family 4 protein [Dokdonia ponticola]|uniref:Glycosyltransferase family 4 protein n=1 Tax=Dokdonia ponticola TaxID=2041041 RepID=A0ABV9I383_9FLAO
MAINTPKVIVISHLPLPYDGIGSWTTLYDYYLTTDTHQIDYIICPEPKKRYKDITYSCTRTSTVQKIKNKLGTSKSYERIFKALDEVLEKEDAVIIKIIDNAGVVLPLKAYLNDNYQTKHCYLQFYYHGFPPFFGNPKGRLFFAALDETILLTHASYKDHLAYYTDLPCAFSVLHNGIDGNLFFKLDHAPRAALRLSLGITPKEQVFLWLSQDRPKKGLDFILKIWNSFYKNNPQCKLWVIGADRAENLSGVTFYGKIPNQELSQYYQAADVYLYPTLCKEGFGLTLTEAMKSGCYCIASANGGIPEVVQHGKLAVLISNPNYRQEWEDAMNKTVELFAENKLQDVFKVPENLYNLSTWCAELNTIITKAKDTF